MPEQDSFPEVVESKRVWSGHIFDVWVDQVVLQEEADPVAREYIDHPGAVAIVALRNGEVGLELLLLRQYRPAIRNFMWEIPAGLRDVGGESLLETAKRELAEEADLVGGKWSVLTDTYTSPGCSNESLRVFMALDPVPSETVFEREAEEASMQWQWVLLDDAVKGVLDGNITNPSAVTGILAAFAALKREQTEVRPDNAPWNPLHTKPGK